MTGRGRLALCVLLCALVLGACRADAQITVRVHTGGSGTVSTRVHLDAAAVAALTAGGLPLEQAVRLDDLHAAGWSVSPWVRGPDGGATITIAKPFASPSQLGEIVGGLSGPRGPLRGFGASVHRSFLSTTTRVRGTVDLRRPDATITSDPVLSANLAAAGVDPAALATQLSGALADSLSVTVRVVGPDGRSRQVEVTGGDRRTVALGVTSLDVRRLAWGAVAVALVLTGIAVLVVGERRRRRAASP